MRGQNNVIQQPFSHLLYVSFHFLRSSPPRFQSELAPTSAPMWMDGALMSAPFSSVPVPELTKVTISSRPFFFLLSSAQVGFFLGTFVFQPPTAAQVSPAYLHLDYLSLRLSLLPPPPTYLLAHLPTHLPTFPSTYLPMYLHTKSPPRQ